MAKAAKMKLPKKVAGLKVPKALRKSAALETLAGSHAGRQILADALVAAAAAAAAVLAGSGAGDEKKPRKGRSRSVLSDTVDAAAGALAGLVTDATQSLAPTGSAAEEPREPVGPGRRPARTKRAAKAEPEAAPVER
jgi:hypothetical protein